MIQLNKTKDKIVLTLISELDREDIYELVSDLQKWLDETVERNDNQNAGPSGIRFHNKEHQEAFEQAMSKNKLAEDMRRVFVDLFDSEYIEKMAKVYELDPITKEVIVKDKKLKDERRNKRN